MPSRLLTLGAEEQAEARVKGMMRSNNTCDWADRGQQGTHRRNELPTARGGLSFLGVLVVARFGMGGYSVETNLA